MKTTNLSKALLAGVMAINMMSLTVFATEETQTPEIQDKNIIVDSKEDLQWISDYSNGNVATVDNIPATFSGYTIKITNDISNVGKWTPIKNFYGNMCGEVVGEKFATISGIDVSVEEKAGLCSNSATGKFSNIKIQDSSFVTTRTGDDVGNYAGAFVGNGFTSSFENCHVQDTIVTGNRFVGGITGACYGNVTNCTVVGTEDNKTMISAAINRGVLDSSGDNASGIVGLMGEGNMKISGCIVDRVSIQGTRQVAGIAGVAQYGNTVENNIVKNTRLHATLKDSFIGTLGKRSAAVGGIVGQIDPGDSVITISNNTVGPNMTITRVGNTTNYCGWLLGDITRGNNYVASGNIYDGTTTLPMIYGEN